MNESDVYDSEDPNEPCVVFYKKYPDLTNNAYTMAIFACVYMTIFVLGIAGNVSIIYVTLRNKSLQTVQNMFILNLAASDVIVCLLSLPITPVTNVYKNWFFGSLMCRLIPWVQGVSIFICTFSLGAIAVDRYVLVVRPHTRPLTRRGALILTAILWSVSIFVTYPYGYYMYEDNYPGVCGHFCTERWPNALTRRAYTMVVMAAQFLVPFSIMAFCYATIFARLKTRAKVRLRKMDARNLALENSAQMSRIASSHSVNCEDDRPNDQMCLFLDKQEKERQRLLMQTRRTTSILVAMVVMFGLTWLPHNVVSVIIEYDDDQNFFHLFGREDLDISYLVNLFTHSFAMTNNITNPVLYAWLNPSFRELVIRTFLGRTKDTNRRVINKTATYKERATTATSPNSRKRSATITAASRRALANKTITPTRKRSSLPVQAASVYIDAQPPPAYDTIEFNENQDTFV